MNCGTEKSTQIERNRSQHAQFVLKFRRRNSQRSSFVWRKRFTIWAMRCWQYARSRNVPTFIWRFHNCRHTLSIRILLSVGSSYCTPLLPLLILHCGASVCVSVPFHLYQSTLLHTIGKKNNNNSHRRLPNGRTAIRCQMKAFSSRPM